ncbi:hypothetical protein U27_05324 [Candidatus Vecturithrix granuli]|uniref:Uncharacterized protein n=1 Tax=Vecturithrix granuli TaxID=1499967 RepID=A0A081C195_VECG1|nr:hypothetical protein U27_05324 [Candidatus Vecturithrix granuli]
MKQDDGEMLFAVCIHNEGYPASLELWKLYQVIADPQADKYHRIRIIDESGEDYLYPVAYFVPIEVPEAVQRAFSVAA